MIRGGMAAALRERRKRGAHFPSGGRRRQTKPIPSPFSPRTDPALPARRRRPGLRRQDVAARAGNPVDQAIHAYAPARPPNMSAAFGIREAAHMSCAARLPAHGRNAASSFRVRSRVRMREFTKDARVASADGASISRHDSHFSRELLRAARGRESLDIRRALCGATRRDYVTLKTVALHRLIQFTQRRFDRLLHFRPMRRHAELASLSMSPVSKAWVPI